MATPPIDFDGLLTEIIDGLSVFGEVTKGDGWVCVKMPEMVIRIPKEPEPKKLTLWQRLFGREGQG